MANEPQSLLLRPEAAAAMLGIGRSKMFELIACGSVETVTIGRSRRVPHDALRRYVDGLCADQLPVRSVAS